MTKKRAETLGVQCGMYVTPFTFERHIKFLKENFCICPVNRILEPGKDMNKYGTCAITFDDGWSDFYEFASPILKKYSIPVTNFLPTGLIGTDNHLWFDEVAAIVKSEYILKPPSYTDTLNEEQEIALGLLAYTGSKDLRLEKIISSLKSFSNKKIRSILKYMIEYSDSTINLPIPSFLSWEQVKELKNGGNFYFGSHTNNHEILTNVSPDVIKQELEFSKELLEKMGVVDEENISFCYPNGNINECIKNLVKTTGYSIAVSTQKGWVSQNTDPYYIERISMHEDISKTKEMFAARMLLLV